MRKTHPGRAAFILFARVMMVSVFGAIVPVNTRAQSDNSFVVNGRHIDSRELNDKIHIMMDDIGITGASLVIFGDDKIVFSNTYGYKEINGERLNDKTVFEACSLSKNFLTYAVYKLVDEGKLNLDTPVYRYEQPNGLDNDPRYKRITTRMLLSHSSGLENWKEDNDPDSLEIVTNPGENYGYSGEGYDYIAGVLETVLHESYESYIKRLVLTPLHLNRTYTSFAADDSSPLNYMIGYDAVGNRIPKWKNHFPIAAGGIHTTAEDYANLIIHFFNGRDLSQASMKAILTPVTRMVRSDPGVYYGPGFQLLFSGDDTIISHAGAQLGFKDIMFYSLKKKCGFVFFTNSDRGLKICRQLCKETVGLNIEPRLRQWDFEDQYPEYMIPLLSVYKNKGPDSMFVQIKNLQDSRQLHFKTIFELGDALQKSDRAVAERLFQQNIDYFPKNSLGYVQLAYLYYDKGRYDTAYRYFSRIVDLKLNDERGVLPYEISVCKRKMAVQAVKPGGSGDK
jgi:CubicO group peptidase (beta-lactamase class C family)